MNTPSVTEMSLVPPSQAELTHLFRIAMRGDVYRLQEEAKRLTSENPASGAFGHKLYRLVREYRIEEIQQFLREYVKETA